MRLGSFGMFSMLLAVALSACGSASGLKYKKPRVRDGGMDMTVPPQTDGGNDGASEFGVDLGSDLGPDMMTSVISAMCDRHDVYTTTHRGVVITSSFTSDEGVRTTGSSVGCPTTTPCENDLQSDETRMSETQLTRTISLTPLELGDYTVHVYGQSSSGAMAACDYVLHVIVGPPVAICPEDQPIVTQRNQPVLIVGDAFDDVGVTSVRWSTVSGPPGSFHVTLVPPDELQTMFTADVNGVYGVQLHVEDIDGSASECTTTVHVTEPPVVMCPQMTLTANTRRPFTIMAGATDDMSVASVRWRLVSRPTGSSLTVDERSAIERSLTFTPDKVGLYTFEFTAVDNDGFASSCEVRVNVLPSPPDAVCPDDVRTTPLSTVMLHGDAVTDRPITRYEWTLAALPAGSSSDPPSPRPGQDVSFTPDIAGEYTLHLVVTDSSGATGQCDTQVIAVNQEGLRIELFWNAPDVSCGTTLRSPCDASDVDLHLLDVMGRNWSTSPDDCYYGNCQSSSLFWGTGGFEDDPRLDIDDQEGFGPENINIENPRPGTYRVGVHLFAMDDISETNPERLHSATAVVNVYCGAGSTTPDATFGPVVLRPFPRSGDGRDSPGTNEFWRVADVTVGADGRCTMRDLSVRGAPDIRSATDTSR